MILKLLDIWPWGCAWGHSQSFGLIVEVRSEVCGRRWQSML